MDWFVNVVMCLAVWALFGLSAKWLEARHLWNGAMTMSCVMWVLLLRFRHPAAEIIPMLCFAGGLYVALDATRLNGTARVVIALGASMLWFGFLFYRALSLMYYFCSSCF
jgi:hypothetical protein